MDTVQGEVGLEEVQAGDGVEPREELPGVLLQGVEQRVGEQLAEEPGGEEVLLQQGVAGEHREVLEGKEVAEDGK